MSGDQAFYIALLTPILTVISTISLAFIAYLTSKAARIIKGADGKLDVIHTLVNSNMTAAMQSEYDSMVCELASQQELAELKRVAGKEPTAEVLASIESTKAKLADLRVRLDDRQRQAKLVELQQANLAAELKT